MASGFTASFPFSTEASRTTRPSSLRSSGLTNCERRYCSKAPRLEARRGGAVLPALLSRRAMGETMDS